MEKTKIIKLWDNEKAEYPLIEIKENSLTLFRKLLKEYQKQEDYCLDDFIHLLKKQKWFIRAIYFDEEEFF